MSILRTESGHVLVLAMTVMAVAFILGGFTVSLGRAGARSSFDHRDKIKVYYIAEAGVEKVLARAKEDADWLWGLPFNTEINFLSGENCGGGLITGVKVKKESTAPVAPGSKENVSSTTIIITSTGEYRGARKTLKVKAVVGAPLNYRRGVWIKSARSVLGRGGRIDSNVFADGDADFGHNCLITGTVTAGGNITVHEGVSVSMSAAAAGGSVTVDDGARLEADVRARGNVALDSGALIGSVAEGEYGEIVNWRDIYYNGALLNNSGRAIDPLKLHPGQAGVFVLPPFPVLEQKVYENTYDMKFAGDKTFSEDPLRGCFDLRGIFLVDGNVTVSGTYRGIGAIVAKGDVTVCGDLRKGDSGSSLLIVSFGENGVDIHADKVVQALIYVPPKGTPAVGNRKVVIGDGACLSGSIICDVLEMGVASQFVRDGVMADLQPGWFTSTVSISSWEEETQIF